jgi:hypothetical protein
VRLVERRQREPEGRIGRTSEAEGRAARLRERRIHLGARAQQDQLALEGRERERLGETADRRRGVRIGERIVAGRVRRLLAGEPRLQCLERGEQRALVRIQPVVGAGGLHG